MSSPDAKVLSGGRDLLVFSLVRVLPFLKNTLFGHLFDDQGGNIYISRCVVIKLCRLGGT